MAETTANIYELLRKVQFELKAPKGQQNTFGHYYYRSAEDILEAVKPHLSKHGLTLIVSDEIEFIGDRYYVKATAEVVTDGIAQVGDIQARRALATAYAREDETKKGMDGAQITGASSSYARKYALNGLFAIDDTKDADTDEQAKSNSRPPIKSASKQSAAAGEHPAPPYDEDAADGQWNGESQDNTFLDLQEELAGLLRDAKFTPTRIRATLDKLSTPDELRDTIDNIMQRRQLR